MNHNTDNLQRTVTIKGTQDCVIKAQTGMSIMDIINSRPDFGYVFPCNGNGKCGKCVIRVLEGYFDVTEEDRNFFNEEKLNEGYRLSCRAILKDDCVIEYHGAFEKKYQIQSAFVEFNQNVPASVNGEMPDTVSTLNCHADEKTKVIARYGIAIDIGTTTIAAALVDRNTNKIVSTYTTLNQQRRFGADVITRIKAANDGNLLKLRKIVLDDLTGCIENVVRDIKEDVDLIVISGNTTMEHILLGYSCETLGVYPFTPVDIKSKTIPAKEMFKQQTPDCILNAKVYVMPGISTYVGADIASGILHCNMDVSEDVTLLIDLGTNGEMAIGNKDKLLVTSTAAGPAFEGGNISCGTGSIDGAVCDVYIDENDFTNVKLTTINDAELSGICGSGVIAVTAKLLENEIIDETGRFDEDFEDEGFVLGKNVKGEIISFTQKDVREIQLAKSAIRAGLETLILRYGISKADVKNIYLAGGFGYHVDLDNAVAIGLLPDEFKGRIMAVGNSALAGAVHVIRNSCNLKRLDSICEMADEISLSDDRDFQEFYMDYMMFEEDE